MNDRGYICYINTNCSISSSHGIHQQEHVDDITKIANEICNQKLDRFVNSFKDSLKPYITEVCSSIWNDVSQKVLSAFTYKTNASVSIALKDIGEIFNSSKTRTMITNAITKTAQTQLNKIKIKL